MTVTTVGTYSSLQTLLQNMAQTQDSLNTDEVEISSGKVSQTFDGLGANTEEFTSLTAQATRLASYQQSNTTYLSQLQTTNTVMGNIQQLATSIQTLISSQSNSATGTTSFQQQLQADEASLASALNTSFSGQYLFGGTNTNTAPVASPLPTPAMIGTPDISYYQGSAQDTTVRIADGQTLTNGVRADNTAFQQVFAGISQALQSTGSLSLQSFQATSNGTITVTTSGTNTLTDGDQITLNAPTSPVTVGSVPSSTFADGQVYTVSNVSGNTFQISVAGVTATTPPAAALSATGATAVGTPNFQNAETLVSNGVKGIIALQATVNANIVTVQGVNTQNQTLQTYYNGLAQNISTSDPVALSSQVAQDQTVLEATYETYARISSLTLASYLTS